MLASIKLCHAYNYSLTLASSKASEDDVELRSLFTTYLQRRSKISICSLGLIVGLSKGNVRDRIVKEQIVGTPAIELSCKGNPDHV